MPIDTTTLAAKVRALGAAEWDLGQARSNRTIGPVWADTPHGRAQTAMLNEWIVTCEDRVAKRKAALDAHYAAHPPWTART